MKQATEPYPTARAIEIANELPKTVSGEIRCVHRNRPLMREGVAHP
jgi:hypothetical protein